MKRKIIFYARISYLDAALEYIRLLSAMHSVSVLIELSQNELKANVLDLDINLSNFSTITSFYDVVNQWGLNYLEPYFHNCNSVKFVIYKPGKNPLNLLKTTKDIIKLIENQKPDYIHFDDFSTRQSLLMPLVFRYKNRIVMNIHDPSPHSGESIWYINAIKNGIYRTVRKFVVFSEFSKNLLTPQISKKANIYLLKLLPYTVFKNFSSNIIDAPSAISFIGRLSQYKGIDLFIEAMPKIQEAYPDQEFIVAGKSVYNYSVDWSSLTIKNLTIIEKHLSNKEVADIISKSKIIVCAYRDATQSGIIMTAFSLQRPVIVSNVGGLPEYITPGKTGLVLEEFTADCLSKHLISFLKDNLFENMSDNIEKYSEKEREYNIRKIKDIYN